MQRVPEIVAQIDLQQIANNSRETKMRGGSTEIAQAGLIFERLEQTFVVLDSEFISRLLEIVGGLVQLDAPTATIQAISRPIRDIISKDFAGAMRLTTEVDGAMQTVTRLAPLTAEDSDTIIYQVASVGGASQVGEARVRIILTELNQELQEGMVKANFATMNFEVATGKFAQSSLPQVMEIMAKTVNLCITRLQQEARKFNEEIGKIENAFGITN